MKLDRKTWGIVVACLTKAENLPYVELGGLAVISLVSRVYLLTR